MQAPGPPYRAEPASRDHRRHAAVAPRHLIGQGAGDDHPAVRGVEAGVAASAEILPPVVVDRGRGGMKAVDLDLNEGAEDSEDPE